MSTFAMGPALLFVPGDRPDRYVKALGRADAVIIDLEDAVDPDARDTARAALLNHPLPADRTIVRVNPADSADFTEDLAALAASDYRTVMLPKAGSAEQLDALDGYEVIALCETAAGVLAASQIAQHDSVVALMWGAEDLLASLSGTSSRSPGGGYREVARYARSTVLLAAAAHGKAAIDTVHLAIADVSGLREEAADAAASGFAATACIHPSQVAVIREAYRPDDGELAFARAVLDAASREAGVFRFRGQMVDRPLLRHAESVLRRAGH
jgi:citrate lyase subunit beta/citryl-CoA lyase